MTSPENPFGPPAASGDPDMHSEDAEQDQMYGEGRVGRNDISASPESGAINVTMYSAL